MFGEKKTEFSTKQGKEIPVWQSPKYAESRAKAVEIIESGKYGLDEGDFWILMNETKSGKMAYTGLIISHNGCLKINDKLADRFRPECVTLDKEGYGESLVYSYCCKEQGIYEVGEVSKKNCRIDYPYAMAFKRMMDRVVLKLSKLAYSGIYSEVEADEFKRRDDIPDAVDAAPAQTETPSPTNQKETPPPENDGKFRCDYCNSIIQPMTRKGGKSVSVRAWSNATQKLYGLTICKDCIGRHYPDGFAKISEVLGE